MASSRRRDGVLLSHAAAVVLCAGTALCIAEAPALAGPRGERVVRGQAIFDRDGNLLTIRTGRRAIINWDNFDIGSGETVRFVQPDGRSRVLNRVTANDPTRIDGTLLANGRVFIVNPAGVVFGQGSVVNVGALYAAAGQMADEDFWAGKSHFTGVVGRVENHGMITTAEAASLIGERVANHGQIVAENGAVAMVAGNDVMLSERGGNIYVRVNGRDLDGNRRPVSNPNAPSEQSVDPGVENTGTIRATRGSVTLGAGDTFSLAIRNSGTIEASGGRVTVKAAGGTVVNSGSISTDVAVGRAGEIVVQGQNVVNSGSITSNADTGAAGRVEVTSNDFTVLTEGSVVSAAGGDGNAKGGEVLIHSYNGSTSVAEGARVDISGGAAGGDGGYAEISAKEALNLHGDLVGDTAEGYKKAEIYIDPDFIIVSDANNSGDPEIAADGTVLAPEDPGSTFSISTDAIEAFVGDVRLEAVFDILIFDSINKINGGLELLAGRDIVFGTVPGPDLGGGGFTTDLSISANYLDFVAGRNFVDNVLLGTKLFSTVGDISLEATTGHTDFALATVPAGRTFYLTQAESMFFGAGPFGLVGNPESTNCVVRVTDGWLILGGDFGGVSGYQSILSIDAEASEFLRVEDNLDIGTIANLRAGDNVEIRGFIHAGETIALHSGLDGTGDVLFQEAGLDFWADEFIIEAGNNTGLATARADLRTNNPLFRGVGGGDSSPSAFTYRQDAAIANNDIASADQFAAGVEGMEYWIESNDATLTVADNSKVRDTFLTLASENGSFINAELELISLDVFGPAILNGDVFTDDDQNYHGAVRLGGDRLLTADTVHFHDTVDGTSDGTESLALAADVVFDGMVGAFHPLENLNVARTTRINGFDIYTSGDQRYNGAVTLGNDTSLYSSADGTIRFGSTLDSFGAIRDLYIESTEGGLIVFADDVGSILKLGTLELHTNGGSGDRSIAQRATIVGEESFSIEVENFIMGQHEKFTTLGSLSLNADNNAVLGDLVTQGNMFVKANTITLLRRAADTLLDGDGNPINDRGLDYVAGGQMDFDGNLVLGGIGGSPLPTFSDIDGSLPFGGGFGFEVTQTPDAFVTLGALTFNGVVLDQRTRIGDGPGPDPDPDPEDAAALYPRGPIPFRDSVIPEVYDLGLLASLGITGRGVSDEEAEAGLDGMYVYNDIPEMADEYDDERQTSATRIDIQTVIATLKKHPALAGDTAQLDAAAAALSQSANNYMSLSQAGNVEADAYRTYLEQTPSEQLALDYVKQLQAMVADLKSLPLSPREYEQARNTLLARLNKDGVLPAEQLQKLIESPVSSVEQQPASARREISSVSRFRDSKGRFTTLGFGRLPG